MQPLSLKADGDALLIEWDDHVTHRLRWALLRERCPCATCRVAREEPPPALPLLSLAEAQPIRATGMQPLGNYAYHIDFSDGHKSGIFSIDLLRRLGEETAAK